NPAVPKALCAVSAKILLKRSDFVAAAVRSREAPPKDSGAKTRKTETQIRISRNHYYRRNNPSWRNFFFYRFFCKRIKKPSLAYYRQGSGGVLRLLLSNYFFTLNSNL
ncbi:MAG: hypothetical protein JW715_15355, partial [Sedimentisphaerales bacterium]|nr:hypothetical protein [Sedimentisphaerales bacterium]